jgi:hypothetical protein
MENKNPIIALTTLSQADWYVGGTRYVHFSQIRKEDPDLANLLIQMVEFPPDEVPLSLSEPSGRYSPLRSKRNYLIESNGGFHSVNCLSLPYPVTVEMGVTIHCD